MMNFFLFPNIKNFRIEAPFSLISDYEPSINHEVDHFAKTVLKLDENSPTQSVQTKIPICKIGVSGGRLGMESSLSI
jgi:hypothetical protein